MNRHQFIREVEICQKRIRQFLTGLCCGDSETADDIAQESFIKAWLGCDGLKNDESFERWVRCIAYNTFISYKRRERVHAAIDCAESCRSIDESDSAFRYQELYAALEKLTVKERTAILLYYMDDYSVKEISELEDLSEESVRKQLSRGREHLRHLIKD